MDGDLDGKVVKCFYTMDGRYKIVKDLSMEYVEKRYLGWVFWTERLLKMAAIAHSVKWE